MKEITLGNAKKEPLRVKIGDETYEVPVAGSLTFAQVKKLRDNDDGRAFFEEYIPGEVLDNLTIDDFKTLTDAWKSASNVDQTEVGE